MAWLLILSVTSTIHYDLLLPVPVSPILSIERHIYEFLDIVFHRHNASFQMYITFEYVPVVVENKAPGPRPLLDSNCPLRSHVSPVPACDFPS